MDKCVCIECGHIFDEEDAVMYKEDMGEYWGAPCYEYVRGCPHCKGDYVEAHKCACCDEWIIGIYIKTDDNKRYCEDCYHTMELGDED